MAMDMERQDNTMNITLAVIGGIIVVMLALYAFGAFDSRTTSTAVNDNSTYSTTPATTYPNATNPNATDRDPSTYPNATNPNQQTTPPPQDATTP